MPRVIQSTRDLVPANNERGAVIGQTGTGKSTLVAQFLPFYRRLAVFDPKRSFDLLSDIQIEDNPRSIIRKKLTRFMYRPKPSLLSSMEAYDDLYRYCYDTGNITVYTDDIVGVIPQYKPPHYLKVCYQMGRQPRVGMISCFQRPSCVPLVLTSEASRFYVFRLTLKDDIKRVQEYCPGYDPSMLPDKHTFYYYDPDLMDIAVQCRIKL